jgi:hypothetical protein
MLPLPTVVRRDPILILTSLDQIRIIILIPTAHLLIRMGRRLIRMDHLHRQRLEQLPMILIQFHPRSRPIHHRVRPILMPFHPRSRLIHRLARPIPIRHIRPTRREPIPIRHTRITHRRRQARRICINSSIPAAFHRHIMQHLQEVWLPLLLVALRAEKLS